MSGTCEQPWQRWPQQQRTEPCSLHMPLKNTATALRTHASCNALSHLAAGQHVNLGALRRGMVNRIRSFQAAVSNQAYSAAAGIATDRQKKLLPTRTPDRHT